MDTTMLANHQKLTLISTVERTYKEWWLIKVDIYIYIYIYIERERERGGGICVVSTPWWWWWWWWSQFSDFSFWALKHYTIHTSKSSSLNMVFIDKAIPSSCCFWKGKCILKAHLLSLHLVFSTLFSSKEKKCKFYFYFISVLLLVKYARHFRFTEENLFLYSSVS